MGHLIPKPRPRTLIINEVRVEINTQKHTRTRTSRHTRTRTRTSRHAHFHKMHAAQERQHGLFCRESILQQCRKHYFYSQSSVAVRRRTESLSGGWKKSAAAVADRDQKLSFIWCNDEPTPSRIGRAYQLSSNRNTSGSKKRKSITNKLGCQAGRKLIQI